MEETQWGIYIKHPKGKTQFIPYDDRNSSLSALKDWRKEKGKTHKIFLGNRTVTYGALNIDTTI